jgi:membrane-associated phospholipid phosphatase
VRRLAAADLALLRLARTHLHARPLVSAVRGYSRLGEHAAGWLALGAAGVVLDRERAPRWRRAAGAVAGAYAANTAVKAIIGRARPEVPGLPGLVRTPTGLSFPSAHATSSFAAARAYSGLIPPAPLYAGAAAMALSRVYLGVHYPSDVLAGAALGSALGSAGR